MTKERAPKPKAPQEKPHPGGVILREDGGVILNEDGTPMVREGVQNA